MEGRSIRLERRHGVIGKPDEALVVEHVAHHPDREAVSPELV